MRVLLLLLLLVTWKTRTEIVDELHTGMTAFRLSATTQGQQPVNTRCQTGIHPLSTRSYHSIVSSRYRRTTKQLQSTREKTKTQH